MKLTCAVLGFHPFWCFLVSALAYCAAFIRGHVRNRPRIWAINFRLTVCDDYLLLWNVLWPVLCFGTYLVWSSPGECLISAGTQNVIVVISGDVWHVGVKPRDSSPDSVAPRIRDLYGTQCKFSTSATVTTVSKALHVFWVLTCRTLSDEPLGSHYHPVSSVVYTSSCFEDGYILSLFCTSNMTVAALNAPNENHRTPQVLVSGTHWKQPGESAWDVPKGRVSTWTSHSEHWWQWIDDFEIKLTMKTSPECWIWILKSVEMQNISLRDGFEKWTCMADPFSAHCWIQTYQLTVHNTLDWRNLSYCKYLITKRETLAIKCWMVVNIKLTGVNKEGVRDKTSWGTCLGLRSPHPCVV